MKTMFAPALLVLTIAASGAGLAQDGNLYGVETTTENDAAAVSGGNVFDFSNSKSNPPAPGLPSFAGGPCIGEGLAGSTSIAGVAVGGGKSTLDDSCQRRNWVQTLIGASQHMSEDEKRVMMRVAVEVMREDPYLAGALERAGLGTVSAEGYKQTQKEHDELAELRAENAELAAAEVEAGKDDKETVMISSKNVEFASSCVVTANSAPVAVVEMLAAKNCKVVPNGEQD